MFPVNFQWKHPFRADLSFFVISNDNLCIFLVIYNNNENLAGKKFLCTSRDLNLCCLEHFWNKAWKNLRKTLPSYVNVSILTVRLLQCPVQFQREFNSYFSSLELKTSEKRCGNSIINKEYESKTIFKTESHFLTFELKYLPRSRTEYWRLRTCSKLQLSITARN